MKSFLSLFLAVVSAFVFSGCASIVSKSTYAVRVESEPPGLSFVVVDLRGGKQIAQGVTPDTVTLEAGAGYFKKGSYSIHVVRDGVVVNEVPVVNSLDGWYIGNVLFGGLIGMIVVDPLTGAMFKLPKTVDISGESMAALDLDHASLELVSLADVPAELRGELVPLARQ
jgi:hypothetical protein